MKWSIQVNYTARDDDGKPFRARTVFQTEADDLPCAYRNADVVKAQYENVLFGAIIPGHHARF